MAGPGIRFFRTVPIVLIFFMFVQHSRIVIHFFIVIERELTVVGIVQSHETDGGKVVITSFSEDGPDCSLIPGE